MSSGASAQDPGADSTLFLIAGTLNGQPVSPQHRSVEVAPGEHLTGSLEVEINSAWAPNAVMAMGITPTWGPHATSYRSLPGFRTPVNGLRRTVPIDFVAPTTPGEHYLIVAYRAEFTAGQVISSTNWSVGTLIWDNGDDIAGWSTATIATANADGTVLVDYTIPGRTVQFFTPATAVRVVVGPGGPPPGGDLVAWYSFNHPGEPGLDETGRHNAIEVVNVTHTEGVSGSAGQFTRGYMQLARSSSLDLLNSDFTLAVFIKSADRTNRNWFTKSDRTTHRYGLGATSEAAFAFHGSCNYGCAISTTTVFDGEWHHVAAVKRGLTAEIWVDGKLEDTGTINPNFPDIGAFAIGRDGECCEWFNGSMDEAKIWSRALSPGEIRAESNRPRSQPSPGHLACDFTGPAPTVVITHGWQPLGIYLGSPPTWARDMRAQIRERLLQSGRPANVCTYVWPEAFTLLSFEPPLNAILRPQLAVPYQGHLLARDLAALLGGQPCEGCTLHLIGHSYGTIVNAHAVQDLTQMGFTVEQVTLLDPALNLTPFSEKTFQRLMPAYPEVLWVDNYIAEKRMFGGILPVIGEPVDGAALDGGFRVAEAHNTIHQFYARTIEKDGVPAGFFHSAVLGAEGGFEPEEGRPTPTRWRVTAEATVDATLPLTLQSLQQTGWGVVTGTVEQIAGPAIRLAESSDSAIALQLAIPDSDLLGFDFAFTAPGDGDWLTVSFDGEVLYSFRGESFSASEPFRAEIPLELLQGSEGSLEVRLNSVGEVNAEVVVSGFELLSLETNHLPVADAGPDRTVTVGEDCLAKVTLDGTGSSDADGDALTFSWLGPAGEPLSGAQPAASLPLGVHAWVLTVEDGRGGSDSDSVVLTAEDRTPPVITSLVANPDLLSPPNHRMRPVVLTVEVVDNCDSQVACALSEVSSNEPEDGSGDGETLPDWEVTGDLAVDLRAERSGTGTGRIYTLAVMCSDSAGNATRREVTVSVPHDRGNNR